MITKVVNSISSTFAGLRDTALFILTNNVETFQDRLLAMTTICKNNILPIYNFIALPKKLDSLLTVLTDYIYDKNETIYYDRFIIDTIECLEYDTISKTVLPEEWQELSIEEIHVKLVDLLYKYMIDENYCGFKINW